VTEILDSPAVQIVQFALRRTAPYECGDGLDQETKLTFALTKCFFGHLLVLDVERDRIPSLDPSLIIEQRIVANQEPAILTVLTHCALLIFERSGAFEGLLAPLAQPFHIVRVEKPRAKVLFLHILQANIVVIQRRLIHRKYEAIGSTHRYERRDGV